jgi:hypothetical protein
MIKVSYVGRNQIFILRGYIRPASLHIFTIVPLPQKGLIDLLLLMFKQSENCLRILLDTQPIYFLADQATLHLEHRWEHITQEEQHQSCQSRPQACRHPREARWSFQTRPKRKHLQAPGCADVLTQLASLAENCCFSHGMSPWSE